LAAVGFAFSYTLPLIVTVLYYNNCASVSLCQTTMLTLQGTYLTTKEVAEQKGFEDAYIRNLAIKGKIPGAVKIGRDWIFPCHPVTGEVQINTKFTITKPKSA